MQGGCYVVCPRAAQVKAAGCWVGCWGLWVLLAAAGAAAGHGRRGGARLGRWVVSNTAFLPSLRITHPFVLSFLLVAARPPPPVAAAAPPPAPPPSSVFLLFRRPPRQRGSWRRCSSPRARAAAASSSFLRPAAPQSREQRAAGRLLPRSRLLPQLPMSPLTVTCSDLSLNHTNLRPVAAHRARPQRTAPPARSSGGGGGGSGCTCTVGGSVRTCPEAPRRSAR